MITDISEILERVEAMRGAYPNLTSGQLGARLISAAAHAMNDPDPERAEYSLAYLVMEAMFAGELISIDEAAGG